jgi:hypothetical protein
MPLVDFGDSAVLYRGKVAIATWSLVLGRSKEKTINKLISGIAFAIMALTADPIFAHHSTAMFDTTKEVELVGTVTDYQWTNPHVWIEIDVKTSEGEIVHYSLELGAPRSMQRNGWKVRTLKAGDKITVVVSPLKSDKPGLALLVRAILPDGQTLNYVRT